MLLFERFEVLDELGAGGFGRVFLCNDRDSGETIALKELHRAQPEAVVRFKREFRVLSDVRHPNLVRLGELFESQGKWGFTLEYVPGTDALSWVRPSGEEREFDEGRLRKLIVDLVHGLMAIHAHGIVHRDIKSANIRVTPQGRAVLLDFGLVVHFRAGEQTSEGAAGGTVAYLAPEQAKTLSRSATTPGGADAGAPEAPLTPAADFYGLGVFVYEALTGQLPFDGEPLSVLLAKQRALPPRPRAIAPGVPLDLDELCMGLVAIAPEKRLDGPRVLASLANDHPSAPMRALATPAETESFVGRDHELATLQSNFVAARQAGMRVALIEGESGIGKTALAKRFARLVSLENDRVLVLRGRCHASEQLAYKAFDGVVDELSRYLKGLSPVALRALLPDQAHLLSVLFPVLDRVHAVACAKAETALDPPDRIATFQAFSELLRRLARDRDLVLVVDDLQWADEASFVLLRALLDNARLRSALLVATTRPLDTLDDAAGAALRTISNHKNVERIGIGRLNERDARTLAAHLILPTRGDGSVDRIAKESAGHPLFVHELARHFRDSGDVDMSADLDAAIMTRVAAAEEHARRTLALLCVSGGPLPNSVQRLAHGGETAVLRDSIATLRVQRLVRVARPHETIVYHDRIREAVLRRLDPHSLVEHHRTLAAAWERASTSDPARVAFHWLGCGEHARAAPWLEQAALSAEQGGAFERAVEHYQRLLALESSAWGAPRLQDIRLRLSDALANAGRCAESARVLLATLEGAPEHEAAELTIRAAQRLLQAARVEEGLSAASNAFAHLGIAWPKTTTRALARTVWNRIATRRRERSPPRAMTGRELAELEALRRLSMPMGWAHFVRGAELVSRHARLAARAGDPAHLAYALSTEGGLRALQQASAQEVSRIFDRATQCRAAAPGPELEAYELFHRGTAATFAGDYPASEAFLTASEHLYRTQCAGAAWEVVNARGALSLTVFARGDFAQLAERANVWIAEAALRGDRFAHATYVVGGLGCLRHLLLDSPQRALTEIAEAMEPWGLDGAGIQHYMHVLARGAVLAYDSGLGSERFWADHWRALENSLLYRVPYMREVMLATRLQTVLARASEAGAARAASLREAASLLSFMRGARSPLGRAYLAFWQAHMAWLEGDMQRAAEHSQVASTRFVAMGHFLFRWADLLAARSSGHESAGPRERALSESMALQGFAHPQRAVQWWLPVARAWH